MANFSSKIDHSHKARASEAAGSCLCGKTAFRISGPVRQIVACHCGQCRKWHGHHAAYSHSTWSQVTLTKGDALRWYRSSDKADRGFCGNCGSSLFWRLTDADSVAIAAGALDEPTGLELVGHIFCESKGDYYEITDDLTKYPGSSHGAFNDQVVDAGGDKSKGRKR